MRKNFFDRIKKQKVSKNTLFTIVFLACIFVYGYNKTLFSKPTGIHQWRNSICAAFALNYYYDATDLKTRTNALLADDRTSDITIVEFPVVYYFVGLLYKLFGPHDVIFRLVHILISYLGLLCLFKASLLILKDRWYALAIPIFIFSSPIYVYYTNNYMPDATCLSIEFIGIYFFLKYYYKRNLKHWFYSMLFLLLGGLIKTPSLIFFFSIGAVGLYDLFLVEKQKRLFPLKIVFFGSVGGVLLLLFAWYAYSKIYSDIHGGSVSPVGIRPIWIQPPESIKDIWNQMVPRFKNGDYHSSRFLYITLILVITNLIFYKKYPRIFNQMVLLTLFGAISFTMIFFRSMYQHDYYQLGNLIIIPVIYLNLFAMLRNNNEKIFNSPYTKIILILALVLLINDCRLNMNYRFSERNWHYFYAEKKIRQFGEVTPYLRHLGINRDNIVYATPDISVNIALYLMDQKGFTDFEFYDAPVRTPLERLNLLKNKGLEYVIIGDRREVENFELLEPHFGDKIGQFGTTEIFKVSTTIE